MTDEDPTEAEFDAMWDEAEPVELAKVPPAGWSVDDVVIRGCRSV